MIADANQTVAPPIQKVVVVNGNTELLGMLESLLDAGRYDMVLVESADRAYSQAVGILGPTVEILNNQGYSYMLRGDYKRAHATLAAARRKDPNNKYVQNNLRLLEESYRKGKSIE